VCTFLLHYDSRRVEEIYSTCTHSSIRPPTLRPAPPERKDEGFLFREFTLPSLWLGGGDGDEPKVFMKVIPLKPRVLFILRHPRVRNLLYVVTFLALLIPCRDHTPNLPYPPSLPPVFFFFFLLLFPTHLLPTHPHTHTPKHTKTHQTHSKRPSLFSEI
jgi:hypothetical protein